MSQPPAGTDSRPLRVVHCIYNLAGGGAERQQSLLCKAAPEAGLDLLTVYVDPSGAEHDLDRPLVQHQRRSRWDLNSIGTIRRAIRSHRADLVHCWLPPVITIPGMLAARLERTPAIASFRSAERFHNWLARADYAVNWLFASGVASNTQIETCAPAYQRLFKARHGALIPNAVDIPDEFAAREKPARTQTQDQALRVIYVGRIEPEKNWPALIRGLAALEPDTPWELTICGQGTEQAGLKALVDELGVRDRVAMPGFVSDVYQRVFDADVLVLPSHSEGMPNVVAEAYALRTPTVLSDIPAHRWLSEGGKNSLLFDPAQPRELTEALTRMARDGELRASLTANGQRCADDLSTAKLAERYAAYYRSVLARQRR